MIQQNNFQSLVIFSVSAIELRSEEKFFKEDENVERNQNKKWMNETKKETKNEKWNEWNIDFLFN